MGESIIPFVASRDRETGEKPRPSEMGRNGIARLSRSRGFGASRRQLVLGLIAFARSAAASSAFLGHAPPLDDKDPQARSPTTEKFDSVTQRMPLKTLAMKAWSEAVLAPT